jgi:hypothetical protein
MVVLRDLSAVNGGRCHYERDVHRFEHVRSSTHRQHSYFLQHQHGRKRHTSGWWVFFCLSEGLAGAGSFAVRVRLFKPSRDPPPDDPLECVRVRPPPERCWP